jgi:UDP-glucose 4-epimerase
MGIFGRQKSEGDLLTIVGDGEQKRDFVNVLDIVEANILAAFVKIDSNNLGTVFNIGHGTNYSVNEVARMYDHSTINIPARMGEMRETLADTSKARSILEWHPKIGLEEWLSAN